MKELLLKFLSFCGIIKSKIENNMKYKGLIKMKYIPKMPCLKIDKKELDKRVKCSHIKVSEEVKTSYKISSATIISVWEVTVKKYGAK